MIFDQFNAIFDSIEQTLNWYRIVVAEDRYLEDKYFYCVRMIEALYKALNIQTARDQEATNTVLEIIDGLSDASPNKARLVAFLKSRVLGNFKKPSLGDIIEHLKSQYGTEIKVAEILDAREINRLRGKEAHGSGGRVSNREYQFMAYAYDILRILYTLIVLEHCGLDRAFLLSQLKNAFGFSSYFEQKLLDEYRQNLGSV